MAKSAPCAGKTARGSFRVCTVKVPSPGQATWAEVWAGRAKAGAVHCAEQVSAGVVVDRKTVHEHE